MTTSATIRDYLTAYLGQGDPGLVLTDDYPLLENEVFDSMALLQLVAFIEERFGVEIDDSELIPSHWSTIGGIAGLVDSKRA